MKCLLTITLSVFFVANFNLAQSGTIEIQNEKYGIVDFKTKKQIADYIYDDVEVLRGTGYLVMQNEKIGLLDKSGKEIFSCIYEDIHRVLDNPKYVVVEDANSYLSVYSIKDKKFTITKFLADMENPLCGPYDEFTGSVIKTVIRITKNEKFGILELPSKIILPIEYDQIISCESKRGVIILKKRNKYRFYNLKDKTLLTPEFELNGSEENLPVKNDICYAEATDYFPAKVKTKWGIMNMYGKFKIPPKFDELRICPYSQGKSTFTAVHMQNQWYTYNYGKMKPFNIDNFLGFWYNYAVVIKNEKVLFYNIKGLKFLEIKLRSTTDTKIKTFQKNGNFGVVSYKSRLIADFEFQDIEVFGNLFCAQKNNKYALMNSQGKELTPFKYDKIIMGSPKNKVLIIEQSGKYGLMSFEGTEIVKPRYTYISNFSKGKATAKLYKIEIEIDTKGNKVD